MCFVVLAIHLTRCDLVVDPDRESGNVECAHGGQERRVDRAPLVPLAEQASLCRPLTTSATTRPHTNTGRTKMATTDEAGTDRIASDDRPRRSGHRVGLTRNGRHGRQAHPEPPHASPSDPSRPPGLTRTGEDHRRLFTARGGGPGRQDISEVPAHRDRWADPRAPGAPETNRDHRPMTPLPTSTGVSTPVSTRVGVHRSPGSGLLVARRFQAQAPTMKEASTR